MGCGRGSAVINTRCSTEGPKFDSPNDWPVILPHVLDSNDSGIGQKNLNIAASQSKWHPSPYRLYIDH